MTKEQELILLRMREKDVFERKEMIFQKYMEAKGQYESTWGKSQFYKSVSDFYMSEYELAQSEYENVKKECERKIEEANLSRKDNVQPNIDEETFF